MDYGRGLYYGTLHEFSFSTTTKQQMEGTPPHPLQPDKFVQLKWSRNHVLIWG
jgi:hypothetical protein